MSNPATTLPTAYRWLSAQPLLPRMVREGLALLSTREAPGTADNAAILGWAAELGGSVARDYRADSVPWCGLFMAIVAARAGKPLPQSPLWALSWAQFGRPAPAPMLGDVLVFRRQQGGHVGLYLAEDEAAYHVLGGNQGDCVSIARVARHRLLDARRPAYTAMPPSVRAFHVDAAGSLSTNEA